MTLGCRFLTVKAYYSGTSKYASEGREEILKCHRRKTNGAVKFSTVLLCQGLYFSDAGGLNIILQRNWISEKRKSLPCDYGPP